MNAIKIISAVKMAATISTLALADKMTYFLPTLNLTNWCSWYVTEQKIQQVRCGEKQWNIISTDILLCRKWFCELELNTSQSRWPVGYKNLFFKKFYITVIIIQTYLIYVEVLSQIELASTKHSQHVEMFMFSVWN